LAHVRIAVCVLTLFALLCGAVAVQLGQSAHWDLRNYHLYNAWAFWYERSALDIAPAQLQSHLNPLLHLLTYALFQSLSPWLSAALLGLMQGVNAVPLYFIARRLLPDAWRGKREGWALACALVGASSATQISQLGASSGDNLVSLPLLTALALALNATRASSLRTLSTGALLGVAAGLKLTAAPMALSLFIVLPLMATSGESRLRRTLVVGAGAALGFALAGGWWHVVLWQRTGNPLFPYFGALFESAQNPPFSVRDMRWIPDTLWDALIRPWAWTLDWRLACELRFRDLRLPMLWLVLLLWPWCWVRLRARLGTSLRWTLVAVLMGYALWMSLFAIHRYFAAWEMLAPALSVALLARAWPEARVGRTLAASVLVLLVPSTNPPNWDRVPFGQRFLAVEWPRAFDARDMLISAQDEPLGYLATTLPRDVAWISVFDNFHGRDYPVFAIDHEIARRLDAHAGRLWLVRRAVLPERIRHVLDRFGLALSAESCAPIRSNLEPKQVAALELCALDRSEPATRALARDTH
jgi:hypothetical protein